MYKILSKNNLTQTKKSRNIYYVGYVHAFERSFVLTELFKVNMLDQL